MAKWQKKTLRLKKNHGWTSEPGCTVFVADRGAVRFDIPRNWVIEPAENGSIKIMDRPSPDDDCTLQMTIFYLPDDVDWKGLPVAHLVSELTRKETNQVLERVELQTFQRDGMTAAWTGTRYIDPTENREACGRTLLARKWNIQPIFTFAYWADQAPRVAKAWDILLKTLVLGDYIEDPTQRVS